jgi:hypothetical protein
MAWMRWAFLGLAAATAVVSGCPARVFPPDSRPAQTDQAGDVVLRGYVDFGPARSTQASPAEVANGATVSLIDSVTGFTAATTRTDASGNFILVFGGGFVPGAGPYWMEAIKGLSDGGTAPNRAGADAARLRTIVSNQSGWKSLTTGAIGISRTTTALAALANLKGSSGATMLDLLGSLKTGQADATLQPPTPDTFTPGTSGLSNQDFHTVFGLVDDILARDLDPIAYVATASTGFAAALPSTWNTTAFRLGRKNNAAVTESGAVQLSYTVPPAPVPRGVNEEAYFPAEGVANDAAGVVAADGQYLYVKCWASYANNTSNAQAFKRIGTGFGGTVRGKNYGVVGRPMPQALTALYWGGYLWQSGGGNREIHRVSTTTGVVDSINPVADSLLTRHDSSTTGGNWIMPTTDGIYAYSMGYDDNGSGYDQYKLRVHDPAQNWAMIREITFDKSMIPGSYYTDGLWVDGIYFYPIEWTGGSGARVRRYRLSDGQMEGEWTFTQSHTGPYNASANDPIAGQWDWVNNKFYIGNLTNEYVHQIKGGTFAASGNYDSQGFDTGKAARYRGIYWDAEVPPEATVSLQVRTAATRDALETTAWTGPTGVSDAYTASGQALSAAMSGQPWVQFRILFKTADTSKTPRVRSVRVTYQ